MCSINDQKKKLWTVDLQYKAGDSLGEVQKALDFLYMAVDSLEASGLFEMNENVRQSKGQHEVTEDFSVDVQEALHLMYSAVDSI